MTFGSLFAGIGGIDLGLERAGMTCKWQVEKDDYACAILKKHWPEVPRWRDIRYFLGGKRWRKCRTAWDVDVIAGGFPCQDISNAGKRADITGARSGLWNEFARIVHLLRPRFVVVENVSAITVRGLGRVLGDLAELGYDAEWDRIPAAAVGAPHLRWRLFVIAHIDRSGLEVGERVGSHPQSEQTTAERGGGEIGDVTNSDIQLLGQRWRERFSAYCETQRNLYWRGAESCLRGVDDGIPPPVMDGVANRADRLHCLGNAVVPQIAEWIGRRIMHVEASK